MKNKGFSLVELLITIVVLSIIVMSMTRIQYFMSKQTVRIKEKTFATQKVIQMMEELRSFVSGSEKTQIDVLDDYTDATFNPFLTTDRNVINPESSPSNNMKVGTGWKYLRKITVLRIPEEQFTRKVYIRVYRTNQSNPLSGSETLAETVSVLKTIATEYTSAQVIDLYIIAIENVPGWWSNISRMKPMFESIIQDLKTRCPQLEIRQHWITRLAYGRDLQYRPYINNTYYTNSNPIPYVYLYPGLTKTDSGADYIFYDYDKIKGKINVDGSIVNDDQYGYSICDTSNNAVRYLEEERLYNDAVAIANATGKTPPEYSLRMLLEKMNSEPDPLKNIILINLHGELLPLPPMRNYSDAAKDPENRSNVRVVTHPERLQYNSNDIKLRVYSYVTNPDNWSHDSKLDKITILIKNIRINKWKIDIDKFIGNKNSNYRKEPADEGDDYEISYIGSFPNIDTLITLKNSPLRHEERNSSHPTHTKKGLNQTYRLYGMEYIPCPVDNNSFNTDLNNQGNVKNTARWIIEIENLPRNVYTIETRIGTDLTTGTLDNKPSNLSKTYTWVRQNLPETEKFQFVGDPRHCPYLDTKQSHYYNWFFTSVPNGDYTEFTKTDFEWGNGITIDLPRFFQIYRQGLLNTTAIWTTLNGFSFYFYGTGGEFGSEQQPIPNSMEFVYQPWSNDINDDAKKVYIDEIRGRTMCIVAKRDKTWFSKYWLGELYPDDQYNLWKTIGNLRTGNSEFYRTLHNTFPVFPRNRSVRSSNMGCASFMNGTPLGIPNQYFMHAYADANEGTATDLGLLFSTIFNIPISHTIGIMRPFTIGYNLEETGLYRRPPEWFDPEYQNIRTVMSIPSVSGKQRIYYTSNWSPSTYYGSGVVRINDNLFEKICYLTYNGLSVQAINGPAVLGRYTLATLLRTFLDGGSYSGKEKILQIPLLEITSPNTYDEINNPTTIDIKWNTQWKRWDGNNYTEEYPNDYKESTPLVYAIKYSNDNGKTWYYCDDNSITFAGRKEILKTLPVSSSSYPWDVSNASKFPKGSYIIRVECFRKDIDLHYSYDQVQIFINR